MPRLVWFRRDLRLADHPALYHACEKNTDGVIALFLLTPDFWQQHDEAVRKIQFQYQHLAELKKNLADLNIPLLVKNLPQNNFAEFFNKFVQEYNISELHYNIEIETNEMQRDAEVTAIFNAQHIPVHAHHNRCILPPGKVLKADNTPYNVFTPFKNKWLETLAKYPVKVNPSPEKQKELLIKVDAIPELPLSYQTKTKDCLWVATEAVAHEKLHDFIKNKIKYYHETRDLPAVIGTSSLSPYLANGTLSARQCVVAALAEPVSQGRDTWISELIWRDFYHHILFYYPRVSKHRAFNLQTEKITWHENPEHFIAWCEGKTGVPIVDAAMRQLNTTGWMHNRLRMVVAMFLTKNLFLDWRLGERYFMQQLLDGDLAANNGGWQWSASTGTDAAPYFRVFNPYRQSEKFDPEGLFIRRYCPELSNLSNKQIHCPPPLDNYPPPIVDIDGSRKFAIETFKRIL